MVFYERAFEIASRNSMVKAALTYRRNVGLARGVKRLFVHHCRLTGLDPSRDL